ncbi:hypothetical protein L1F30_11870 [Simiduia sp. 21SJ11W-1]|uniref:hypothetical protein n=1 Tax=Simiduia sp. 21SJ11W-1 TaxID=2909669 RepID=UPI00209D4E04|nr:hypothetical protein [Simiduia sp. 21SJ11W-1]UTA46858.1 hypothetical protein L1F30_11870 [Simiduia sp. 21SJ11W-1]
MTEESRCAINAAMVGHFQPLRVMYEQLAEDARLEREARLAADWQQWQALDEESKAFVLGYLAGEYWESRRR